MRGAIIQESEGRRWRKTAYRRRLWALLFFFVLLLGGLLLKVADLQLIRYEDFKTRSERNRIELVAIPPLRSSIYDRNGKLLATNRLLHKLEAIPQFISRTQYRKTLAMLAPIVALSQEEQDAIIAKIKTRSSRPIVIRKSLEEKEVARIAARQHLLEGFYLVPIFQRFYPYKSVASHVIGYVGGISQQDIDRYGSRAIRGIPYVGRTGIEAQYDEALRGKSGYATIEQDAYGASIREINRIDAFPGKAIRLSIDIDLQQYAEELISPFRGSIVALDTRNGEVLAMASMPRFDLNIVTNRRNSEDYRDLLEREDAPLVNRAINGLYPPGSTFKPFVALAALEQEKISPTARYFAAPYYVLPGAGQRRFYDWRKEGHGWVNMNTAIAQSCDVYFYDLAYKMGIDDLYSYVSQFTFGRLTGIDLYGESPGLLPSRQWKRRTKDQRWFSGETIIFGIGQGYLQVTPLQLAVNTLILANRGRMLTPRLVPDGDKSKDKMAGKSIAVRSISDWEVVIRAMQNSVAKSYGTARGIAAGARYSIAGKTGTAQLVSLYQDPERRDKQAEHLPQHLRDHSLFIAFAPVDRPRVAVAVIIENGGSGSTLAAPLARAVMDKYFGLYPIVEL